MSTSGASAVTVTVFLQRRRRQLQIDAASVPTSSSVVLTAGEPLQLARDPIRADARRMRKLPRSSVTVSNVLPVAACTAVTVTPGQHAAGRIRHRADDRRVLGEGERRHQEQDCDQQEPPLCHRTLQEFVTPMTSLA